MKKLAKIYIIVNLFCGYFIGSGKAQITIPVTITPFTDAITGEAISTGDNLTNSFVSFNITERDNVKLLPGFSFIPNGTTTSFNASINSKLILSAAPDYLSSEPTAPTTVNTNGPVGNITGSIDVSPTGAATYQIPLFTSPGTGGMQPSISIVYNSQGGNGLLGKGWDIAGLSVITRVPQTVYQDGQSGGVNLDANDRYSLDGNRLLVLNSATYGSTGASYETETKTFSNIISAGTAGNGPQYFTVTTKDGKTIEYGNSSDSRIVGINADGSSNTTPYMWRVNKITDANGNYMTFTYTSLNGESAIDQINYTGNANAGLSTYNSLQFYYDTKSDVNTIYVGGAAIGQALLLRAVRAFTEGALAREYDFVYSNANVTHLNQITEVGSDGSKLNASIVNWSNTNTPVPYYDNDNNDLFDQQILISGDFNGDGKTDWFAVPLVIGRDYNTSDKWTLYLNNGDGTSYTVAATGSLFPGFLPGASMSADINGDGLDDIIFASTQTDPLGNTYYQYRVYNSKGSNFDFTYDDGIITSYEAITIFSGDFDGDGSTDLLLKRNQKTIGKPDWELYANGSGYFRMTASGSITSWGDQAKILDFNGDGKKDIMVVDGQTTTIYTIAGGTLSALYSGGFPTKNHEIFLGDFNGDGKTDLLTYLPNTTNPWNISYSTGSGFISTSSNPITRTNDPNAEEEDNNYLVCDFNGDGKSDILEFYQNWVNGVATSSTVNIYYSTGTGFYKESNVDNSGLDWILTGKYDYDNFVDLNGDGKADIFCNRGGYGLGLNNPENDNIITFHANETPNLVNAITNGFSQKTQFAYKPLTNGGSFYTKGSGASFPLNDYEGAMYAVSSLTVPDGVGNSTTTTYNYAGAKVHEQGLGFLGFTSVTASNSVTDRQVTTTNTWDNTTKNAKGNIAYKLQSQATSVQTISSNLSLSNVVNNFTNTLIGNSFFTYVSSNVASDYLTGITTTTINNYGTPLDVNGNIQSVTKEWGSAFYEITSYANYIQAGSWIPNKPMDVTITRKHPDDGNPFTNQTRFNYDATTGNVTKEIKNYNLTTDKSVTTNYTYNSSSCGNPLTIATIASSEGGNLNLTKTYTYEAKCRFVASLNDQLSTTQYTYEPVFGNLIKEIKDYGGNNLTTTSTYDAWGNLSGKTLPDGNTVAASINWATSNKPTATTLYYALTTPSNGPWVKKWYDAMGRELRDESVGFKDISIYSDVSYNAKGQVSQKTSYLGAGVIKDQVTYTYNSNSDGRIALESYYNTKTVSYTYYPADTKVDITTDGKKFTKTYDYWGNIWTSTEPDPGGTISYKYKSCGKLGSAISPKSTITNTYDALGNQTGLSDPDAGNMTYRYDPLGRLTYQKDAKGFETYMFYDNLNRLSYKQNSAKQTTVSNTYVTSGNGLGQIAKVTVMNGSSLVGSSDAYTYDNYGRVLTTTRHIDGTISDIVFQNHYDPYGNVDNVTYPGNYIINNKYDNYGNLTNVLDGSSNNIWMLSTLTATQMNYSLGSSGLATTKTFDTYGSLSSIVTSNGSTSVQKLVYNFNDVNGVLNSREDQRTGYNLKESFTYDNLYRLTDWNITQNGTSTSTNHLGYKSDQSGNIDTKPGIGSYTYGVSPNAPGPHQLYSVTPTSGTTSDLSANDQFLTYNTDINKVSAINENNYELDLYYGPDNERVKTVLSQNGTVNYTKYFGGLYEKKVINGGNTLEYLYIPAGDGLAAVLIKTNSNAGTLYYLHKDHLGSIVALTDASGNIAEQYNYDPWGRRRNPTNWLFTGVTMPTLLSRGFTGHEHIDELNLINMNGRFYDPLLGMFISPDNNIQSPTSSQNFNRYSYCMGNPLMFDDKTGEWFGFDDLVVAIVGAVVGYVSYGISTGDWGGKALAAAGVGAAVAWLGWNTLGAGAAALGHAGNATSLGAGISAVFGSASGEYGLQFASLMLFNSGAHADQLKEDDQKGWGGVMDFAAYSASSTLSTSLDPSKVTIGNLAFRQWAGVVITDNISDNMEDGKFKFHSLHIGLIGYDFDRHDKTWGGLYTIFSKGSSGNQRFDMAFETIVGLSLIKDDIVLHRYNSSCGVSYRAPHQYNIRIPTSEIGYFAGKVYEYGNDISEMIYGETMYEKWFGNHYNDNADDDNYGTAKY
jgi:RHS repeat-associated protein